MDWVISTAFCGRWRVDVRFSGVSRSIISVYRDIQDSGVEVPMGRKMPSQGEEEDTHLHCGRGMYSSVDTRPDFQALIGERT